MEKVMQRMGAALVACLMSTVAFAGNETVTVSQVTEAVVLTEAVDYVITSSTPFTSAGSIDIQNSDAVVIFSAVKPSEVKSTWLSYISLNGTTATTNNAWAGIYQNGAIVYPHTKKTFQPLTVYTEEDFGGESSSDWTPYTFYNSSSALGDFENNIRSFKLKRGYMVTFACMYTGLGYSRCFIAQEEDLEVSALQSQLSGKVGFIRVFPWNRTTKKGYAGNATDANSALNTTWHYGWDAGTYEYDDYEYVPQHHHEGWPSWSTINGLTNCNTMLGNNEPDNYSDSKEQYINPSATDPSTGLDSIEVQFFYGTSGSNGTWISNAYTSGFRVITPAMSSNITGWLSKFVSYCEEYNCRLDGMGAHCYWQSWGSSFDSSLNWYYSLFGLPIWITEFNNGANWTTWPLNGGDYTTVTDEGQAYHLAALSDIVTHLEANSNIERYAIYNWVGNIRSVYLADDDGVYSLTPSGEWYAALQSGDSYTYDNGLYMSWTYKSPTNLNARYYNTSKRVLLNWTNMNGKQTDSTYIERMLEGETTWTVLDTLGMPSTTSTSYSDTLSNGEKGLITYRIHNFDSDNKQRYSGEAYVTVGGTDGNDVIQFGSLSITDPSETYIVEYENTYESRPAVFIGLQTNNTSTTIAQPYLKTTNIKVNQFTYATMPWNAQSGSTDTFDEAESVPFMVLPADTVFSWGDLNAQVGVLNIKDTTEITFASPFDEGVTPVVIATLNNCSNSKYATIHKVFDVTNTGFKAVATTEEGNDYSIAKVNQSLAYFAIAPGTAIIDEENDIRISAGVGYDYLVYRTARNNTFYIPEDGGSVTVADPYTGDSVLVDTLLSEDPVIFAEIQTCNTPVAAVLRGEGRTKTYRDEDSNKYTYNYGMRTTRIVDTSVQSNSTVNTPASTADVVGWVALHGTLSYTPDGYTTGIEKVSTVSYAENPLEVRVKNRIVYVKGVEDFDLYTVGGVQVAAGATQEPGVYVVRYGKQSAKVLIQ